MKASVGLRSPAADAEVNGTSACGGVSSFQWCGVCLDAQHQLASVAAYRWAASIIIYDRSDAF